MSNILTPIPQGQEKVDRPGFYRCICPVCQQRCYGLHSMPEKPTGCTRCMSSKTMVKPAVAPKPVPKAVESDAEEHVEEEVEGKEEIDGDKFEALNVVQCKKCSRVSVVEEEIQGPNDELCLLCKPLYPVEVTLEDMSDNSKVFFAIGEAKYMTYYSALIPLSNEEYLNLQSKKLNREAEAKSNEAKILLFKSRILRSESRIMRLKQRAFKRVETDSQLRKRLKRIDEISKSIVDMTKTLEGLEDDQPLSKLVIPKKKDLTSRIASAQARALSNSQKEKERRSKKFWNSLSVPFKRANDPNNNNNNAVTISSDDEDDETLDEVARRLWEE